MQIISNHFIIIIIIIIIIIVIYLHKRVKSEVTQAAAHRAVMRALFP